ncbi:MAG: hypothetical protein OHK0047_11430 [Leptolyngbyaceae cyanobacterium]
MGAGGDAAGFAEDLAGGAGGWESGGDVVGKAAEVGDGGGAVGATGTNFVVKRLLFIAERILFPGGSLN